MRRKIEIILFVIGVLILVVGLYLFLTNIGDGDLCSNGRCLALGLILVSVSLLLYSKDIEKERKQLSILLKILAWFWIILSIMLLPLSIVLYAIK